MTKSELLRRTKSYAIENAKLILQLPYNVVNKNYCNVSAKFQLCWR
jgi:hypothetical protein